MQAKGNKSLKKIAPKKYYEVLRAYETLNQCLTLMFYGGFDSLKICDSLQGQ
jgi:hypothetical protein